MRRRIRVGRGDREGSQPRVTHSPHRRAGVPDPASAPTGRPPSCRCRGRGCRPALLINRRARIFVDTNVLFPFSVMDLVLALGEDGVHTVVWTDALLDEWERVIVDQHRRSPETRRRSRPRFAASSPNRRSSSPTTSTSSTRCPDRTPTIATTARRPSAPARPCSSRTTAPTSRPGRSLLGAYGSPTPTHLAVRIDRGRARGATRDHDPCASSGSTHRESMQQVVARSNR